MQNGAYSGPTKRGDSRGPVGDSRISDAAKDPEWRLASGHSAKTCSE
jgi:hypothetical protein